MTAHSAKAVVLFDSQCEFCRRSVALLRKLDWLGKFTAQSARDVDQLPQTEPPLDPARLLEEMHLVTPRGQVAAGFVAYRWMAWRLPVLWPLAPFLYLPGVLAVGNRLYRWVARRRFHIVPCKGGVCQIPPRSRRV